MKYLIEIEQAHMVKILSLLETVPAPLRETWPVYESLRQQQMEQDRKNAIHVGIEK